MSRSNGTVILPPPGAPEPQVPNSEVVEHAHRRCFMASYKMRILHEADDCAPGQLGALLRREGLYSSHLAKWRQLRDHGGLAALAAPRRGRPARDASELALARLRQENERLTRRLSAAEAVIDIQKKVSALLGLTSTTGNPAL